MHKKRRRMAGFLAAAFLAVASPVAVDEARAQSVATEQPAAVTVVDTAQAETGLAEVDVAAMTEWRRDFHRHPETAYEETRTAAKIDSLLTAWGIETYTNIGKTGVVGILRSADADENNPSICLRADIDALNVTEANAGLPYASETPGKMHACGHDGHAAMLLGAAKYLSETKDFTGTVYFIFQPAEEGQAGAKAMIDDGLFDIVDCDGIYGMHTWPSLAAGEIGVAEGNITANSDRFTIKITGKGGHAAYPANNIDVVALSAEIVSALHAYKTEHVPADEGAVLAVTMIHGGEAQNAMPETLELGGTVRTFADTTQDDIEAAIKSTAETLAEKYGATVEVEYNRGYPSVYNSPAQTDNARGVAESLLGADNVIEFRRTMAGEDFSYYTDHAPGAYIALGQWDGDGAKEHLHSPGFDFNDDVLKTGASYWVRLVEDQLPAAPAPETGPIDRLDIRKAAPGKTP